MAKTKNTPEKHAQTPPLTQDELLQRDNIIVSKHPPAALHSLISTNSLTFPGTKGTFQPEVSLQNIESTESRSSWHLKVNRNFIRGLPGQTTGRLASAETAKVGAGQPVLESYQPDWADVIYHPKFAGIPRIKPLRRINGNRIKPLYVFGNDVRQPFYPQGYPWQCIGKLLVWTNPSSPYPQFTGSAALVGKNVILTAGHMAPWGANPWMVQFVPAYYDGVSTLGTSVYSYVEAYYGYNTGDQVAAWDMLVMKLYDPLGDWLGYFGSKAYADNWQDGNYWTLVGYPGAIANAERPSSQSGISIHDDDEDGDAQELETDNGDASPGDSGGPFFAFWNDGPYIIGTISGEEEEYQFPFSTEDNNIAVGGNALNNLIAWARNNW